MINTMQATGTMREVPEPVRGAGPVECYDADGVTLNSCRGHRARCLIGHAHVWSTWCENGKLQRTPDTFHCHRCGGVCIADEVTEN